MNAYEQNGQKRFESGSVTVSYFPHIAPNTSSKLSVQQKVSDLETKLNQPQEIPLNEALHKGDEFQKELSTCRSIQDKDERNRYKRKHLGAYSASGTFWTRDKDVPLEVKIKKYNSLMALDFDDEKDLEGLRNDLKSLPWVYYAGLSASGKGMFALVPLDTDDYRMHKTFFEALKAEMESLGHKIDKNCSDVTRLRFVSYDPNPYINENCIRYSLPEEFLADDDTQEPEDEPEIREITSNERLELYVQEWERKKIVLDDYADWAAIGLSLSHEGEAGLAAFQRVLRFSDKYKPFETEMKFRSFESGNYSPGLGTFFYKCHQFGVVPESIPHYECIPFPVEVFPKQIQEIIRETNLHQNFPVDYIADPVKINDTCIGVFGGIQPEILGQFAKGKIQSGFVDRWLFAFPEKVKYPKFNDVDIDEKIARNWKEIVDKILELPFDDTPKVVKLSPGAKLVFKEWFDKLAEQKNNGGTRFAGLATKMDRYCGRMAQGIEIMKYGCKESELLDISEDSMRCSIALCYYFLACGLKAQKRFMNSPTEDFTQIQREVYDELPQSFETKRGLEIAQELGMPARTFKRWLNTSLFKKISYGFYEKKSTGNIW